MTAQPIHKRWCKPLAALALGVAACLLPAGQAQAGRPPCRYYEPEPCPVFDATTLTEEIVNWGLKLKKWEAKIQNWLTMLSTFKNIPNSPSLSASSLTKLSPQDIANLVAQSCPGPGIVSSTLSLLTNPGLTGNIPAAQQQICQQIIIRQTDKYNLAVDMINRVYGYGSRITQIQNMLDNISSTISGITGQSVTNLANQMNATEQNMSQMDADMSSFQSSIKADNAAIASLQQIQSKLAQTALNGSSVLGQVVQATALKAALDIK